MSEQKQVKFTWYHDDDDGVYDDTHHLILRHDNRIQGVPWQRVTDSVLALRQAGFIESVTRHPDDDKVYVFKFHAAPTLDNILFCQQYIEATVTAIGASWYAGMQLSKPLAERLEPKKKAGGEKRIRFAPRILKGHASKLKAQLDAGTINYRQAFDSLANAVEGADT